MRARASARFLKNLLGLVKRWESAETAASGGKDPNGNAAGILPLPTLPTPPLALLGCREKRTRFHSPPPSTETIGTKRRGNRKSDGKGKGKGKGAKQGKAYQVKGGKSRVGPCYTCGRWEMLLQIAVKEIAEDIQQDKPGVKTHSGR